ncbi:hypothetical protein CPB85DRAFT_1357097 [Mucidula mucida]|nr:hypothetical protein CPB85DRAFT_1357097 [Mucidula mucida]
MTFTAYCSGQAVWMSTPSYTAPKEPAPSSFLRWRRPWATTVLVKSGSERDMVDMREIEQQ